MSIKLVPDIEQTYHFRVTLDTKRVITWEEKMTPSLAKSRIAEITRDGFQYSPDMTDSSFSVGTLVVGVPAHRVINVACVAVKEKTS